MSSSILSLLMSLFPGRRLISHTGPSVLSAVWRCRKQIPEAAAE